MEENNKDNKIILATRALYDDQYEYIREKIKFLASSSDAIYKSYIVCNLKLKDKNIENIEIIFDEKPIKTTAFNLVIEEFKKKKNEGEYHLLTFSKEVDLDKDNIKMMLEELEKEPDNLIVVGYRLRDNILSKEECELYYNGTGDDRGIAYQVPWNTCALWNKKFIYGKTKEFLKFDKICEKNQLSELKVKIDGKLETTEYRGMEDGLAIAELVTKNHELKFKLIEEELGWNIQGDEKRIKEHKSKMARKNIVLATFMNIKGYSIDALRNAKM